MHIHIVQLVVIGIFTLLGFYVNDRLNSTGSKGWVHVGIVVVAILAVLGSLLGWGFGQTVSLS